MRKPFAAFGLLTLFSACGYNPQPGDGLLPCDHGCPTGYVCRSSENRCYHASAPMPDASPDGTLDEAANTSDALKEDARSRLGDGASRADGPASDSLGGADSPLRTDLQMGTDATLPNDTRPGDDASEDLTVAPDVAGSRADLQTGADATLPKDTRPGDGASDDLTVAPDVAGRRDVRAGRPD